MFMLAVPALHAAAFAPLKPLTSYEKSKSAFSKEREKELHKLRGKIITAHSKDKIFKSQRDIALKLHDVWSHNKAEFDKIFPYAFLMYGLRGGVSGEKTELAALTPVVQSLASLDQALFDALKEYESLIDINKKDEKKS